LETPGSDSDRDQIEVRKITETPADFQRLQEKSNRFPRASHTNGCFFIRAKKTHPGRGWVVASEKAGGQGVLFNNSMHGIGPATGTLEIPLWNGK